MFRKNITFIMELADRGAPVDQILSVFVETFLAIEEHLEIHGGPGFGSDRRPQFQTAMLAIVRGVDALNSELNLRLEGNINFLRSALRNGDPPDGVLFFMARTLDAVRAPIDNMRLSPERREKLAQATAEMTRGLHELEPLL
ncbi:MAG: hypothetical protein RIF32_10160 [Leptospirales bacterium]|jgi:hypothetical protein